MNNQDLTVMNFFKTACKLLPGWISHTGKCGVVFSETRTCTALLTKKVNKINNVLYRIGRFKILGLFPGTN